MDTHPQALEAAQRANERRMERDAMKKHIKACQAAGVLFVEVHPTIGVIDPNEKRTVRHGHMTIAYHPDRRNVVQIATALCHPNDNFCKVTGRFTAAMALAEGRSISLRKPSYIQVSTGKWLANVFTTYGV
jgi:hypothetical protein